MDKYLVGWSLHLLFCQLDFVVKTIAMDVHLLIVMSIKTLLMNN